ncbi:YbaB/EbfC family nucleoid-associated protein [Methylomonas sp. AM2-LC]|uniref:YbaB/EbfC family nucleoid-associated protein n=1 Tax=Methylomonas sp. AM2-LC TaxID=3153301 RepID=UPI003264835B
MSFGKKKPSSDIKLNRKDYEKNQKKIGNEFERLMASYKQDFDSREFKQSIDSDRISVVLTGNRQVKSIHVDQELLSTNWENVEENLVTAINQCISDIHIADVELMKLVQDELADNLENILKKSA